ncbi:hypothetical protein B0H34DRAFT_708196 [Crassisporium funariophilum]|nr:hypothetical protein B0H34DRAFT_708196 [Crassisporium funariophilum]
MDALESLSNILNEVAENPLDVSIHARHIKLAQSLEGMEAEAVSAMEMMTDFVAAGDEVWLPLINAKEKALDLETEGGVEELLELYAHAEADYMSIPILQKHLELLIERHALYTSGEQLKPSTLGDVFSTTWTREAINEVVKKAVGHLTQSHKLWDAQRDWELEMLEASSKSERISSVEHVQALHLVRLRQPHSNIEETFQSYSSFTTNYLPPDQYEPLLVSASKIRGQSTRNYDRREPKEQALSQTGNSLEAYNLYTQYERKANHPDLFVTRGTYERAIAEAAKRRFNGEAGAEEVLRIFWSGYCDALRILEAGMDAELEIYRRAVRSVPGSGEVWARYIRFSERVSGSPEDIEDLETVAEIFNRAIDTKLLQSNIDQLAPVILARAGYEKRQLEVDSGDEDALPTLIGVVESGIAMAHQASETIDPKLRLEKFLAQIYEDAELVDSALDVWRNAVKHSQSSYLLWLNYTDALIKHRQFDEARKTFVAIPIKHVDWPEAIWEAWISFEHRHGSLPQIESCLDKVEKAQNIRNAKIAKDAQAEYAAMQIIAEAQASVPVAAAPIPQVVLHKEGDARMDVDQPAPERGTKRSAEEEVPLEGHKKARIEHKPPPMKRDRENATVFVADLPRRVTDDDLKTLFKDCGNVREVKITDLSEALVATVEFFDRDSVPAALTKDKKRIHEQEISVHLAWRSTLYVTNFPETADDPFMRNLFGKYGTIFDARWPSKKFKNTRRFCYIQFTSPDAAQRALELHGRELEPNLPLSVYLSNPERKKERTDQDANEREVYVAGLSRFTNKEDLEKIFQTYGHVKDIRIALEENGNAKGFAFVEFEDPKEAQAALAANNHELKKRRMAVTLSDPRVRARHTSEIGLSRVSEARNRSVRIKNLPPATQEGLLQQVLEKIAPVKRVEVFIDKQEAVVELQNPADAGRLLLRTEPIVFMGNTLEMSEDAPSSSRQSAASNQSGGAALFRPRHLGPSKPRAGLGHKKIPAAARPDGTAAPGTTSSVAAGSKGQDDFRKMLLKK